MSLVTRIELPPRSDGERAWGFEGLGKVLYVLPVRRSSRYHTSKWLNGRRPADGAPDGYGSTYYPPETLEDALEFLLPWPLDPQVLEAAVRQLRSEQASPALGQLTLSLETAP